MTCKLNTGDVTVLGGGQNQADSNVIKNNNVKDHYGDTETARRRPAADLSSHTAEVNSSDGGVGVVFPTSVLLRGYRAVCVGRDPLRHRSVCIDVFTLPSVKPRCPQQTASWGQRQPHRRNTRGATLVTNKPVPPFLNYKNSTANEISSSFFLNITTIKWFYINDWGLLIVY